MHSMPIVAIPFPRSAILLSIIHHPIDSIDSDTPGRSKHKARREKSPYAAVGDGGGRLLLAEALHALRGRHICCLGRSGEAVSLCRLEGWAAG